MQKNHKLEQAIVEMGGSVGIVRRVLGKGESSRAVYYCKVTRLGRRYRKMTVTFSCETNSLEMITLDRILFFVMRDRIRLNGKSYKAWLQVMGKEDSGHWLVVYHSATRMAVELCRLFTADELDVLWEMTKGHEYFPATEKKN